MAKNNFYTVTEEINGTKYIAQFAGLSTAFRAVDATYIEGTNNTSLEKMAEFVFENIIVEPKGLTLDDFDDLEEANAVISFASKVMQGQFREKKNEGAAKKAGKE